MSRKRTEKSRRRKCRSLKRQKRIEKRLRPRDWAQQDVPMLRASNIHYEVADRTRALDAGGIGVIHQLARQLRLPETINAKLQLLKRHLPYHESDHVLNIAYNMRNRSAPPPGSTVASLGGPPGGARFRIFL